MEENRTSGEEDDRAREENRPADEDDRATEENRSGDEDDRATKGTAPSAANIDDLEKFEPSEEAKRAEPSDVDAMGQDKRRQIVGQTYGPTARRQIMFFVAVAAVLFVIIGGWLLLVGLFDKPPTHFKDSAPWSTTASNAALAEQQNAKPTSPLSPCGEPGNKYPVPPQDPCAPPSKANDFQGTPDSGGR